MHLPRVRAVPVAVFLCVGIWLSVLGCAGERVGPPIPTEIQVSDIPADDGTNVAIGWRHFTASSARQYDVYFSSDPDSLENNIGDLEPLTRTVQATIHSIEDSLATNIEDVGYYLLLDKEGEIPIAHIIKATPENRDSLERTGEKIIAVEHDFAPPKTDDRELKFALGGFFRVRPPEGEIAPTQKTIREATLSTDSTGLIISEGKSDMLFDVGLSKRERDFISKGERVEPFDEACSDLLFKYGREILAIVTENTRYSLPSENLQALLHGQIEAGIEYSYKIIIIDKEKNRSESEVMTFTPVDEPPLPATNCSAVLDENSGKLLTTWMGYNPGLAYFRDIDRFEIRSVSENDTALVGGDLLGAFSQDFDRAIIEGDFTAGDEFYIATFDKAGARVVGEPYAIVTGELSSPEMVRNMALVDVKNDDGGALAIQWGVPTIGITLNITDFSPEYDKKEIPDGYYLVGNELVRYDEGDTAIPANALPVYDAHEWIPAEAFEVVFRYQMYMNDGNKVYYAKLRVDEGKWEKDFQEMGFINLPDLPAGEHIFEAILLDPNGKELENPEASIVKTVLIDKPGLIRDELPGQYVQVWCGNKEIMDGEEVLLEGTYNLDPKNQKTYKLGGTRGYLSQQYQTSYPDSLRDMGEYYYFCRVIDPDGSFIDSDIFGPMTPKSQFFHSEKTVVLVLVILFVVFVNFFLAMARKGKDFYLRPIAGITHLDEALGRATEMGRPILYVLGLTGISDIATLAGLTILGRVAKKAAEFQTRLLVPCYNPIVLIVAQETVKTAFMDAGRPDAYNEDDVFFAAGSQFSYAAAVAGMMVRYRTAANFYMGMFFAESLILTETGSMSGSIQIAGTDAVTQIPFFITTCDYTLIGEELYAASAYLSHDPLQVGTLKAQDMLKVIYMIVIVLGTVSMTSGFLWFVNLFKIRLEQ